MKALVLGGCGFIGSHIVDALLHDGHSVRVFDHSPEKMRQPLADVDYRFSDFSDVSALKASLQHIDVVFHSISTSVPASSNASPADDIQNNLTGSIRLLEAMRDTGVNKIVFLSSGGTVYGKPNTLPVPETHSLNPVCSYGVVKVAIEHYLFMYEQLYGLQSVILRPSNPYGPRQGKIGSQGVISTFAHQLLRDKPITIWGDGKIIRDFFHVEDLARLCVTAASSKHTGIYNAGGGVGHSILDILNTLAGISGLNPDIQYLDARPFDINEVVLDIHKARSVLEWEPRIALNEGLSSYMDWLSNQTSQDKTQKE